MGFLGTNASVLYDLNLLLQLVLLVVLLLGFRLGRIKSEGSLKLHRRLMRILVVLNAVAILFVMGPSLLANVGAALGETSFIGFPLTLTHHTIGLAAEILGVVLAFRKFGNVRLWMRVTFILWLIALVLGIGFYVRYYVVLS